MSRLYTGTGNRDEDMSYKATARIKNDRKSTLVTDPLNKIRDELPSQVEFMASGFDMPRQWFVN